MTCVMNTVSPTISNVSLAIHWMNDFLPQLDCKHFKRGPVYSTSILFPVVASFVGLTK